MTALSQVCRLNAAWNDFSSNLSCLVDPAKAVDRGSADLVSTEAEHAHARNPQSHGDSPPLHVDHGAFHFMVVGRHEWEAVRPTKAITASQPAVSRYGVHTRDRMRPEDRMGSKLIRRAASTPVLPSVSTLSIGHVTINRRVIRENAD